MESEDIEIINPRDEINDNVATSAKASQSISSKWLVFCLFVLLGHVLYLVMNLVSEMLLKQEAVTITNEQLTLIIEAMFVIVVAGKYIHEAENLVTMLKSVIFLAPQCHFCFWTLLKYLQTFCYLN